MSILLRNLGIDRQTGETPSIVINNGGIDEDLTLVDRLEFAIIVEATSIAGAVWTLEDWLRRSTLSSYWRVEGKTDAEPHVKGVSILQLGQLAAVALDGSLDVDDNELPATQITAIGANTFTFVLRVPLVIPTMLLCAGDTSIRLSEIGKQEFTFGDANNADLTITAISVTCTAICRPTKKLYLGLLTTIESQSSNAPKTEDNVGCAPDERIVYLILASSSSVGTVNQATIPKVSIGGKWLIDGTRLASVRTIQQVRGEAFYPQSSRQASVSATTFCPLLLPSPRSKFSELPGGQQIRCEYQANGMVAGRTFYTALKVKMLTAAQAQVRSGRAPEDAQRALANGGVSDPSVSTAMFIPAQF